jgi:hypothetical protein
MCRASLIKRESEPTRERWCYVIFEKVEICKEWKDI